MIEAWCLVVPLIFRFCWKPYNLFSTSFTRTYLTSSPFTGKCFLFFCFYFYFRFYISIKRNISFAARTYVRVFVFLFRLQWFVSHVFFCFFWFVFSFHFCFILQLISFLFLFYCWYVLWRKAKKEKMNRLAQTRISIYYSCCGIVVVVVS